MNLHSKNRNLVIRFDEGKCGVGAGGEVLGLDLGTSMAGSEDIVVVLGSCFSSAMVCIGHWRAVMVFLAVQLMDMRF